MKTTLTYPTPFSAEAGHWVACKASSPTASPYYKGPSVSALNGLDTVSSIMSLR